ncbi:unnamed protein product [Adineta steineri]|uniref:Nuclear receptor domain-containing protein n=1 Tax=Adineta steineri TaxID=433720 RepID=A0A820AJH0_9BILA|nr:unnamed protein product [Adineta steineri]CAF4186476.1 unnamed protein product [Adineta steineri]
MTSIFLQPVSLPLPAPTKNKVGRRLSKQSICLVCGDIARIINYGALCCQACKTFFRRNVSHTKGQIICRRDGNCKVTKHTRLGCTACRLKKCFSIGMDPNLIRIADRRDSRINNTKQETMKQSNLPLQTLDLLKYDRSSLTSLQWTLLSNVTHAYDKFDPSSIITNTMKYLRNLPAELLFDASHTYNLFTTYYTTAQSFVASAPDYKILTINEQHSLLKRNLNGLFIFCAEIVCRDLRMLENPVWSNTLTYTLGSDMIKRKKILNSRLEQDTTLIKLMLIIIAFSSNCYMLDDRHNLFNDHLLLGTFRLFGSQNVFVEILWKYMIYRYGYRESVLRFTALIKQTLDLISLVVNMYKSDRLHRDFVDDTITLATSTIKLDECNSIPLWGKTPILQRKSIQ